MQSYSSLIKNHLAAYKRIELNIEANGTWRKNSYPHILPATEKAKNILQPYRESFWEWLKYQKIKLHTDFHHLNSSQAMAFNLFYPFMVEGREGYRLLGHILGLPDDDPIEISEFEKVFPKEKGTVWKEGTNFDFYIRSKSGAQVFFELKLTEQDFGTITKPSDNVKAKWKELYVDRLRGKVTDNYLDMVEGFKHYQILRNISYVDTNSSNRIIFLCPKQNEMIMKQASKIREIAFTYLSEKVDIVYLEGLVNRILEQGNSMSPLFISHYEEFCRKYTAL